MGWVSAAGRELDRDTRERLDQAALIDLALALQARRTTLEAEVAQLRGEPEQAGDGECQRHQQQNGDGEGDAAGWDIERVAPVAGDD